MFQAAGKALPCVAGLSRTFHHGFRLGSSMTALVTTTTAFFVVLCSLLQLGSVSAAGSSSSSSLSSSFSSSLSSSLSSLSSRKDLTPDATHLEVRSLSIKGLRCGCGKSFNFTQELLIRRVGATECFEASEHSRRPRGLSRKGQGRYPLAAKVRGGSGGAKQFFITWNLTYMARNKRSAVTGFYLHFLKTRKSDSKGSQRRSCFHVQRPAKVCRTKVRCVASAPSQRRTRRLHVQILYRLHGRRARARNPTHLRATRERREAFRGKSKFNVLKSSLGSSKRSKRKRRGGRKPRRNRGTPPKKSRSVFVDPDEECEEWRPDLNVTVAGHEVRLAFKPLNAFATGMALSLEETSRGARSGVTSISNSQDHHTFTNVRNGTYSVVLRPTGKHCHNAGDTVSARVSVPNVPESEICSWWDPFASLAYNDEGGGGRHEVTVTFGLHVPTNLVAHSLEIRLEEDRDRLLDHREVALNDLPIDLNISFTIARTYANQSYSAMVRPLGCRDCVDYQLNREPCFLAFKQSNAIRIPFRDADSPVVIVVPSPSTGSITASPTTTTAANTTTTTTTARTTTSTPGTPNVAGSNNHTTVIMVAIIPPTSAAMTTQVIVLIVSGALIVVALVAATIWRLSRGRRATPRRRRRQQEADGHVDAEPAVPLVQIQPPPVNENNHRLTHPIPETVTNPPPQPCSPHYRHHHPGDITAHHPANAQPFAFSAVDTHLYHHQPSYTNDPHYQYNTYPSHANEVEAHVDIHTYHSDPCHRNAQQPIFSDVNSRNADIPFAAADGSPETYNTVASERVFRVAQEWDRRESTDPKSPDNTVASDQVFQVPQEWNRKESTDSKCLLVQSSEQQQKKSVFLVHNREDAPLNTLDDILGHFASILETLNGGCIEVRADIGQPRDNPIHIQSWVEDNLRICSTVVVVLSETLVELCKCYRGCKREKPNCCTDIAPFVLNRLSNGTSYKLAVFVHFGLENAERELDRLLGLYAQHRTRGKDLAPAIDMIEGDVSGTAAAGDASAASSTVRGEMSREAFCCNGKQSVSFGKHQSCDSSGAPLGKEVVSSTHQRHQAVVAGGRVYDVHGVTKQATAVCQCQSWLKRPVSAPGPPEGGDKISSRLDSERTRHLTAPSAVKSVVCSCPSSAADPLLSGCRSFTHLKSPPSSSSHLPACTKLSTLSSGSVCCCCQNDISRRPQSPTNHLKCSLGQADPLKHETVQERGRKCDANHGSVVWHRPHWQRDEQPRLISLKTAEGLKEFLRILCRDEHTIDRAVASDTAQELFHCISRRYNDQNPREPIEHSCPSSCSPGSRSNLSPSQKNPD